MLFLLFLVIVLEVSQNKNFIVLCDAVCGTYDNKVEILRVSCVREKRMPHIRGQEQCHEKSGYGIFKSPAGCGFHLEQKVKADL